MARVETEKSSINRRGIYSPSHIPSPLKWTQIPIESSLDDFKYEAAFESLTDLTFPVQENVTKNLYLELVYLYVSLRDRYAQHDMTKYFSDSTVSRQSTLHILYFWDNLSD
ncbi:hypothetical protein Ple7327_3276 [Pleurocapsa sp. PCC 7327]|uniref:hypothetical protein n=1 Tax=Pleurocapsa sp. PCC 7327 TaxID=118163 RepID=UPI00029FB26A|nr:hypothetical protein [Pleurocapsa sp. PCC 7327]AFY78497.1 hypothetical protein Ple7327_3276 [Pleurocapsa sp. PCC 7327]